MGNPKNNSQRVYSQAEYEHFCFAQEPFSGFVEGIGYTCTEVVITAQAINRSGTEFMFDMNFVCFTFVIDEQSFGKQEMKNNTNNELDSINNIPISNINETIYTSEEFSLMLEKSQSYSFNQGYIPPFYRIGARMTAADNFFVNIGYNMLNDVFQVVQFFSCGAFARDEWLNPFTGSRYGNLDGTPNYEPIMGFINTSLMVMPAAAGTVGNIPKGALFIESLNTTGGAIKQTLFKGVNMGINFINGQVSRGMGILKSKNLAPDKNKKSK